jgi:hypothetical protein
MRRNQPTKDRFPILIPFPRRVTIADLYTGFLATQPMKVQKIQQTGCFIGSDRKSSALPKPSGKVCFPQTGHHDSDNQFGPC